MLAYNKQLIRYKLEYFFEWHEMSNKDPQLGEDIAYQ
jgi:hypothetical protein